KTDGDQLIVGRQMIQLEHGFDGGPLAWPLYEKASMRKVCRPADRPAWQRHQCGGGHRKDGANDYEVVAAKAGIEQWQPLRFSDMGLTRGHFDHRLRCIRAAGPYLH